MKKTLITLAIATLTVNAANAAVLYQKDGSKVTLYGSARILLAKQQDARTDLLNDQSRFWLNFSQEIDDDYSAFAAMQLRPQTKYDDNFSSGFYTHRLYAGIENHNWGKISFGNQSTIGNRLKVADFTYKFGGVTAAGVASPGIDKDGRLGTYRTYGRTHYGLKTSAKKDLHVETVEWNGFTFGADYSFAQDASEYTTNQFGRTVANTNLYGWQTGILFFKKINDIRLKANVVYGFNKPKYYQTIRSIGGALGFGIGPFDFGVDYLHDRNRYQRDSAHDSQTAWQLGARYYVTYPWSIYTAYRQTKFTDNVKNKGFALGTDYRWTRYVKTFLEYATNKAHGDTQYTKRQNGYYAGLRVDF
ncbi:hypothetical protein A6A19_05220 [Actinobacillus delphinicola]|uniref:porin n=1 Tax=Actinobacillus delphinicola TaxID=51161 RepID=UPI0024432D4B|nr:porin [Actinobacillus delphinicola]MDG6897397.1 hypothetical protein [Actinobacillus delphinicola]